MRSEATTVGGNLSWFANEVGSILHLRFVGALDVAVVRETADALREPLTGQARSIVFDVADVSFIDSTGVQLLADSKRRIEADRGRLFIARPSRSVQTLLELAGLETWFDVLEGDPPPLTDCPVCGGEISPLAVRCVLCGSAI